MDRNFDAVQVIIVVMVALRKESVDRNFDIRYTTSPRPRSLSARRAWIEILTDDVSTGGKIKSLSARRAWIEILTDDVSTGGKIVALRKESVDRNLFLPLFGSLCGRRSPQGERG